MPDLLTRAANGTGATFAFSYRSSAAYDNRYLPFTLETLAAVSVDDGNGVVATKAFSYADGYYDPQDAEFRGFSLIEQTLPDHTTEETLFHQDAYLRGKERQVDHKDPADKILSRTSLTWSADTQYGAARFAKLRTNRAEHFYSPSVVVQDDYGYSDTHGHVVSQTRSGTGAEAVTTTYGFRNCGFWMWRPERERLAGSVSGLVRDTFFDYDSRGNKIVEERWNNGGGNPRTRWSYDAYGNPATKTDAMGYTAMSVRPFAIEFYLPRATRADQVAALLERIEAHTLDARPFRDPVEEQAALAQNTGVHPAVIKVALSAVVWFLAVAWLDFSGGAEADLSLAVVTGFFVMFFTLFLVTASMAVNDQRWQLPKASFRKFLDDTVPIDRGTMRGRDVLIHIAMLPVTLAVTGTLIGLVWSIVRAGS